MEDLVGIAIILVGFSPWIYLFVVEEMDKRETLLGKGIAIPVGILSLIAGMALIYVSAALSTFVLVLGCAVALVAFLVFGRLS